MIPPGPQPVSTVQWVAGQQGAWQWQRGPDHWRANRLQLGLAGLHARTPTIIWARSTRRLQTNKEESLASAVLGLLISESRQSQKLKSGIPTLQPGLPNPSPLSVVTTFRLCSIRSTAWGNSETSLTIRINHRLNLIFYPPTPPQTPPNLSTPVSQWAICPHSLQGCRICAPPAFTKLPGQCRLSQKASWAGIARNRMLKIHNMSRHFVAYGCKKPCKYLSQGGFVLQADFLIDTCDIPPPTGRISPAKVSGRYSMPPLLVAEAVLLEAVAGATIVARPAPATADAKDTVAAVPSRAWSCKECWLLLLLA